MLSQELHNYHTVCDIWTSCIGYELYWVWVVSGISCMLYEMYLHFSCYIRLMSTETADTEVQGPGLPAVRHLYVPGDNLGVLSTPWSPPLPQHTVEYHRGKPRTRHVSWYTQLHLLLYTSNLRSPSNNQHWNLTIVETRVESSTNIWRISSFAQLMA